jgi:hypothetical protein
MERPPVAFDAVPWQGPVDLSRVVRDVVNRSAGERSHRIRLTSCLAGDLPWLEGDQRHLGALVAALIGEATERLGAAGGWVQLETRACALGPAFLARARGAEGLDPGTFVCLRVTAGSTRLSAASAAFELCEEPSASHAVLAIVEAHAGALAEESRRDGTRRITVALPPVSRRRTDRMVRVRETSGAAPIAAQAGS